MLILTAILAAVTGAVLVFLWLRSGSAVLESGLERAERECAALRKQLGDEQAKFLAQTAELSALKKTVEMQAKAETEKLALLEQADVKLREAFKALSADALDNNSKSFLQMASMALENYQIQARGDLEQRQQAVATLVSPIQESLKTVDQKIAELENARREAYGSLTAQVASLISTQEKLQSETGNLVKALRSPQVRGRWGEMQLRRVVEMAGMLPYSDFQEQMVLYSDDGRLRPDLIVRLPAGKTLVVDSKTPLQAYLNAMEAETEEGRLKSMAEHARQVRDHIDSLGSRNYWDQLPSAPDFVVMFLPGEIFFSAALEADAAQRRDQGLIEYGIAKKVVLASPTTLIAILKGVAYGWQQEKIAESAQEISALGKELFERLCIFSEFLKKLGGSLGNAVEHYNDAIGSLEKRLLVTAREFPRLGVVGKRELPELAPISAMVQALQAPETVQHISIELPATEQVNPAEPDGSEQ